MAPEVSFSLAPSHSDSFENQTILNALVGTLVKYDVSGRIEPYLASSWSKSNNGRRWEFSLHDHLECEDGTPITAKSYVLKLQQQLRTYAKSGRLMVFDQLEGWLEFTKGRASSILGLKTSGENSIIFEFTREQHELLEFLRMPYFGFWCDRNFVDGKFRDDNKFTSSGSYLLRSNDNGRRLLIEKNQKWFSVSKSSPDVISFSAKDIDETIVNNSRTIVRLGASVPDFPSNHIGSAFHKVRTAPFLLTAFVLSPLTPSGFFKSKRNRQILQSRLQRTSFPDWVSQNAIYPSASFYSHLPSIERQNPRPPPFTHFINDEYLYSDQKIIVSLPNRLGSLVCNYIQTLAKELLSGIPDNRIVFETVDSSDPITFNKLISNRAFDIRVSTVDIGGNITNSIIDMMFCTKLGVSFPDPSGRICELVTKYKEFSREADEEYIQKFNQVLTEDAFVLPLFHSGLTSLFSEDIDPETIPSGTTHPRFEDFRFINGKVKYSTETL
ncbi:MAG: hypothetical protein IPJ71_07565 [Bdellovibrionales bacterium]|nr:hypothetical protein [Bdellovibrionales bacterium]